MARYILRRGIYAIITIILASIVIFWGLRVSPGSPENTLFNPFATPQAKAALANSLGLNRPIVVQYFDFWKALFHGNLGNSIKSGQPVTEIIRYYGRNSLELIAAAVVLSYLVSFPLGVLAALRAGSWIDRTIMTFASIGMGIPNFFLGIVLIQLFAVKLGVFPIPGGTGLAALVLPALTLAVEQIAITTRLLRSSMLDELELDYVRTLKARGLSRVHIVWKRVLRNALLPVVSLSGLQVGALIGYTGIVEVIFRWPGIGQALVNSILERDYPVALWLSLLVTTSVILANFIADVAYVYVDPRVRLGGGATRG